MPKSVMCCGKRAALGMTKGGSGLFKVVTSLKCNSWQCEECRKKLSKKWIRKINPQKVERFITLTVDTKRFPDRGQALKQLYRAYKHLVQAIRRRNKNWEYFSVIEFTQNDWPHLHILQRGSYVEEGWVSKKWDEYGMGIIVEIQAVWGQGAVKHYLTKYMSKEGQSLFYHLRKVRFSRGFFQKVEKVKTWLSHFWWEVSSWSAETEIACLEKAGWKVFAREGDACILNWVGWPSGFRLASWSGSF